MKRINLESIKRRHKWRLYVDLSFLCCVAFMPIHFVLAGQKTPDQELFRPRMDRINSAVKLVPAIYQKDVLVALRKSGKNGWELMKAVEKASPAQREGMAFLIANMPGRDLVALKGNFLLENTDLAYQVMQEVPWGKSIPQEIFLNDVLPYAIINEHRDNWRADFYQRFIKIAKGSQTIDRTVVALNKYVFDSLRVAYSATKRPKPDQSPYESMRTHYASCTGLSILLTDALRAVGIPARIVAIPLWADESGNHTWVEIWDGQWHYIGAGESTVLDHAWFTQKSSRTDVGHPIFATSFKKTGTFLPMCWAPGLHFVRAVNVTGNYTHPGGSRGQ
jgi:hypothetical protein